MLALQVTLVHFLSLHMVPRSLAGMVFPEYRSRSKLWTQMGEVQNYMINTTMNALIKNKFNEVKEKREVVP